MLHDFFKLQFFRRFIYNELPISFKHMRLRNEARRNADQPLLRNHQEFPTQDFLLRKNSPSLATPASGAPSLMKTSRKPTAKPPLTLTLNFFICFTNSVLNILIIDCCVLTATFVPNLLYPACSVICCLWLSILHFSAPKLDRSSSKNFNKILPSMSWNSGLCVQAGLCLLRVRPVGSQLPTRRDIHRQVGMSLAFLLFLDIIVYKYVHVPLHLSRNR